MRGQASGSRLRASGKAAAVLVVVMGCRPLPSSERADAGFARLSGVRLERIKGAHTTLDVTSPSARLSLDGTHVVMERPSGRAQERPDAAVVHIEGEVLEANPGRGDVRVVGAVARDAHGRTLSSPLVRSVPDAGAFVAEGPVLLRGENFEMRAAGAVVTPGEELQLVGPVEADAWPRDGG